MSSELGGATAGEVASAAVVIMARAPRRGEVRRALEEMIGVDGALRLHTALLVQTLTWAREVAPGNVFLAHEPAGAGPELRGLLGYDVHLFPQNGEGIARRVADVVARVYSHLTAPVLVVWPDLPQLRPEHAEAALSDLAGGAELVLGPTFDGGFYLVGLARPLSWVFELPEQFWRSGDGISAAIAAAGNDKREVGILRAERALHRPADVRALLADPTIPAPLAKALGQR
jgi:glycosyltransferase A (GT-A) superfamily protein (DUF2064 family)